MENMKTVETGTATFRQLNWAVAKISGMAMREPVPAQAGDFKHKMAPFKLFDVFAIGDDDNPAFEVREVTVTRIDIKKGCSAPTVDTEYFDHAKMKRARATASLDFYYATRDEAELDVVASTKGSYSDEFNPVRDWNFVGKLIDELGIMFGSADGNLVRAYQANSVASDDSLASVGADHREAVIRLFLKKSYGHHFDVPESI